MFVIIALLIMASIVLIASQLAPGVIKQFSDAQAREVAQTEKKLDKLFILANRQRLLSLYTFAPAAIGLVAFVITRNLVVTVAGLLVGFIIPSIVINRLEAIRRKKFSGQIIDMLMLLSSSLKAGLSILQALEVVSEEMAAPMGQEIGIVAKENKIGLSLEASLDNLRKRIGMHELDLVINSIILARETGGNLTSILARLCTTIRDHRKLKDSIETLTLQGRMQGLIMSALPFLFVGWVIAVNPRHFDIMLSSDVGRLLLVTAIILQVVGIFLIRKFSSITF